MFQTIVHHTVKDLNNPEYIEKYAPFPADKKQDMYLGRGFYFWDHHIELAHWWGRVHYASNYVICEGELIVENEGDFLDLVGSRQDMIYFQELIKTFKIDRLAIGAAIEFLREHNRKPGQEGTFPFTVIRAADISDGITKQNPHLFVIGKKGETRLNPKYIICLINKSSLYLRNFKITYPHKYCKG